MTRIVGPSPIAGIQWTNIPSDMIPTDDDSFDLGSATKNWRHLFLSGNVTVDTASWIGLSSSTARIVITDASPDTIDFVDALVQIGDGTFSWGHTPIAGGLGIEGILEVDGNAYFDAATYWSDGTDTSLIKHVQEPGLGGRLTIGLDETARTMVIADAGDVDTDLGLSAESQPTLVFLSADATKMTSIDYDSITYGNYGSLIILNRTSSTSMTINQQVDHTSGNILNIASSPNIEFTDTDGEQSWLYLEPKINQSSTGAYNALKVNVLEETPGSSIGDGTTGDGNNLLNLAIEGVTKYKVDRTGAIQQQTEKTHGGYITKVYSATSGTLTGATDRIELNIPSGWRILQCQLHVKTTVEDDGGNDTWSSEFNDGAQVEVISAGSAAGQDTNVDHWAVADTWGTLTDAETDILLTPQGGSFTAGEIEATCIARGFDTWDNE